MSTQLDMAKKRLFEKGPIKVRNIKLFPGSNRDTTPELMAKDINKILTQLEAGELDIGQDIDE